LILISGSKIKIPSKKFDGILIKIYITELFAPERCTVPQIINLWYQKIYLIKIIFFDEMKSPACNWYK